VSVPCTDREGKLLPHPFGAPFTWQTNNILCALKTMARRMYTAEDTLASIKASENWENGPDTKKRRT
jgi:hypothetical protein